MAEERIMICSSTDYTITETDKGDLFEGKIEPHNANVFTRTEAIERIAKAITFEMYKSFPNPEKEVEEKYTCYINYAEAALNALLSEGK